MSISSNYSSLANTMWHLKNPNAQTGTMLIELPADVGRAYSGYKRGGIIEGSEKFRKEVMSAAVWLFGIPVFNKIGNFACEKLLKIPMDIDYSNAKDGRDAIRDSIEYLADQTKTKGLDVSDLKKYVGKFEIKDIDKTVKKIKGSKQAISIAAWVINCVLMGIVLPKINQKITRDKLKENKNNKQTQTTTLKTPSFNEFQKQTNKNNNISFGSTNLLQGLTKAADAFTYGINTNNTCRLISTDVPMIIGRCATARNKYEALEIGIMDTLAIYFYNFSLNHVEKLLRRFCPTPDVNSKVAEYIANLGPDKIKEAILKLEKGDNSVEKLFGETAKNEIYKQATFGKFGKINKFIKNDELKGIDKTVENLLIFIKEKGLVKNGELDSATLKNFIKKTNTKGATFYGVGIVASFLGLGVLIPKIAYGITKIITGKDGFIGISEEDKK